MRFKEELEKMNATDEEIARAVDIVRDSIPGASMFRFSRDWGFSSYGDGITEDGVLKAAEALGAINFDDDNDTESLPGRTLSRKIEDKMNGRLLKQLA